MPLPVKKLDDRQFQDLVDEAKKRIPHYCKEWTDHNVSDPGVTVIELFAWMTEILLFRLNQVPDLHYIRFMEMLGIHLLAPVPAKTRVTFYLSKPQDTVILIPDGTEVSTTQTEKEPSIIFTTDTDFRIHTPQLSTIYLRTTNREKKEQFREQKLKQFELPGFKGFDVFSQVPQVDDAMYLGFSNDMSHHVLGIEMEFGKAVGTGINPNLPPYVWEAYTGDELTPWAVCEVESDTTLGMNEPGLMQIHLPKIVKHEVNGTDLFWVRVRIRSISQAERAEGMQPYDGTPQLQKISTTAWGGSVPVTHAQHVSRELIGRTDGSPGQRFQLQMAPILKRTPQEILTMQVNGEPAQAWKEVPDFAESNAENRHYTLDSVTGELRFGPAIRQPDGTIKLYGAIPPRGANLHFERYRRGGGQEGNVEKGRIDTLKTAIPFINRVVNRERAQGGRDHETLEEAMHRTPALLRSRERAVTEADFEFLAQQALRESIGRVRCIQPQYTEGGRIQAGLVYVLVIPRVPTPEVRLEPNRLEMRKEDIAALTEYLDERRLLTTRLEIRDPAYIWVSVRVQLGAVLGADRNRVEADVLARLYRFLNPLTGGREGNGWVFGRDLFISDVYQCLQGIPDVQFIRNVEMALAHPGGRPRANPEEIIKLPSIGVVASGVHQVEFV